MFLENQHKTEQENYFKLLQAVGSLSGLFSDSLSPYLYYRSAERAFCKAFNADDLSREDSSYDAKKSGVGIGLKTFLYKNGSCIEKVAEFNSASGSLRALQSTPEELIIKVAELRNKRINFTSDVHGLSSALYHCVARREEKFSIFECPLVNINIDKIKIDEKSFGKNTLSFKDNLNEYRFSLSKSTLFKKFNIADNIITDIPVSVLEDPFELIQNLIRDIQPSTHILYQSVILPLYSERDGKVPEKSGLNQWNAGGRNRNEDEAYIPIPKWIYTHFKGFFPSVDIEFDLELPNGASLSAKPCQGGGIFNGIKIGKALMSNPNKDLGNWILRKILKLPTGKLCTLEMLEDLEIDSVQITKISGSKYTINFAPLGAYKDFCNIYRKT